MKILYFFLFLWVIFPLLDPDPDPATQINADPCGSGSETLHNARVIVSYFFILIFTFIHWSGSVTFLMRIRIRGSVPWITDTDLNPALFFTFLMKFFSLLLTKDTFTSVFKDNKLSY
jgi:hypothetical protein